MQISEENVVIAYFWQPGWEGGQDVVHVAIEIKAGSITKYLSLWPRGDGTPVYTRLLENKNIEFKSSFSEDVRGEHR